MQMDGVWGRISDSHLNPENRSLDEPEDKMGTKVGTRSGYEISKNRHNRHNGMGDKKREERGLQSLLGQEAIACTRV